MKQPKYNFYATLLDKYQGYIGSSVIYNEYWGFSENPEFTEEEFHEKQRLSLLDTINRVPFSSPAADKGTAFNEIVDCIIENRKSEKMEISKDLEANLIMAIYKEQIFQFPISLCREFADYYKGGITQVFTEGYLNTKYGSVKLYGYTDTLMPFCVHDLYSDIAKRLKVSKTTVYLWHRKVKESSTTK